jgi:hypothetical protein
MHKNFSKEDLIAFLENRTSNKQANEIYHYLLKHSEVFDNFFPEEEWQSFNVESEKSIEWTNQLWSKIQNSKKPSGKKLFRILNSSAAAILVIVTCIAVVTHLYKNKKAIPIVSTNIHVLQKTDTILVNTTSKILAITLEDNSRVQLFPSSVLKYQRGFERDKRDIRLSGKAVFTVAHDKRRPFTVFTKNFSTTALGTIFMVEANENSKVSNVHLLQGKVVVKNLAHPGEIVHLLAGQECSFNEEQNTLRKTTTTLQTQPFLPVKKDVFADGTYEETASEIIFKNLSLPKVLDKLSSFYHKSFCFENEVLEHRKFSGTINKHQSLEMALNNLCYLNGLQISKGDSCIRISLQAETLISH